MMKKRIFSGVLATAITLSGFAGTATLAQAAKPEANPSYSCDFTTDYTGFTDFFTTNVAEGMSIVDGALKLTGSKNVWASDVADFDDDQSWEDSFAYIDADASEELHTLAKHMSNPQPNGHGLVLAESE